MINSYLISFNIPKDNSKTPILLIGKKRLNQSVEIINAITGDEVLALYKQLIKEKGE